MSSCRVKITLDMLVDSQASFISDHKGVTEACGRSCRMLINHLLTENLRCLQPAVCDAVKTLNSHGDPEVCKDTK